MDEVAHEAAPSASAMTLPHQVARNVTQLKDMIAQDLCKSQKSVKYGFDFVIFLFRVTLDADLQLEGRGNLKAITLAEKQ
jgi:hypothetical protein